MTKAIENVAVQPRGSAAEVLQGVFRRPVRSHSGPDSSLGAGKGGTVGE